MNFEHCQSTFFSHPRHDHVINSQHIHGQANSLAVTKWKCVHKVSFGSYQQMVIRMKYFPIVGQNLK